MQTSHSHQGKLFSARNSEFSDIRSIWKCKQSHSAMRTRNKETKDERHNRTWGWQRLPDQNRCRGSWSASWTNMISQIHTCPIMWGMSRKKSQESLIASTHRHFQLQPLVTLAFPTCTNSQETATCKSFSCSTPNMFWSLETAHGSITKSGFVLPRNTFYLCHQENGFFSWQHHVQGRATDTTTGDTLMEEQS